jgi:hypothetical protein
MNGCAPVRASGGPYAPAGTAAAGGSLALAEFPDPPLPGRGDKPECLPLPTAEGEAAGATVRTTTDVAVAQFFAVGSVFRDRT